MIYFELFNECRHEINTAIREKAKKRIKKIMLPIYYYKSIGNKQKVEELANELTKLSKTPIEDNLMK